MKIKSRRALRAVAAIALAGSLLGVQALTGNANADTTVPSTTWRPGSNPTGTGFWSNTCPTAKTGIPNDSTNLHTKLSDDQKSVAGSLTMAPENGSDVGWHYGPASGVEAGPSMTLVAPNTTSSIGAQVQGTTSGHAIVFYQATGASDYYVGIANVNSAGSTWGPVTATTFSWYHWSRGLLSYSWSAVNTGFLSTAPVTVAAFATGAHDGGGVLPQGVWYASIELGCAGAFAIDHLQVTNASGTAEYDLQNPATTTTTTASAAKVGPGGASTVTGLVTSGSTTVAEGAVTLWSSVDNGATWTQGATSTAGVRNFVVKPTQNTQYKVTFNGTTNYASSDGSSTTVQVAPALTLRADRSVTNVGVAATFTAAFKPVRSDVPVTFQQKVGAGWQTLGTIGTNTSGVAVFKRGRAATGLWTVRAVAATQPGLLATGAPTTAIKVYQPVTIPISASPRTLYAGGSIRISGVLTQRLGRVPVELQQRVGGRWITYAKGRTGAHGAYTFVRRANSIGTATFRVVAPASGYRRAGTSAATSVRIISRPVYNPPPSGGGSNNPPPPPPPGGGIG